MNAAPAALFWPSVTWATLPSLSTLPVTDVLPGRVICARSPVFTSSCCDGSRATCPSRVPGGAGAPLGAPCAGLGGPPELTAYRGDPHRLGQEDRLTEIKRPGPILAPPA